MTLRTRLFLSFASVVVLLVLAQWWWVRSLTADLSEELGSAAFEVGSSVAGFFSEKDQEIDFTIDIHFEQEEQSTQTRSIQEKRIIVLADSAEPPREVTLRETVQGMSPEEEHATSRHVWLHREVRDDDVQYISLVGADQAVREIRVPNERFRKKIEHFTQKLLLGSFAFLGIGLVLAGFVAHRTTEPLRHLAEAAREVGSGELGTEVTAEASGEVGEAIHAFNRMSQRLAVLDESHRRLTARKHLGEIGEIARGLAHTLRNPLNALGLSVDELAGRVDEEDGAQLAASARRQIRRIDQAIRSFLVLASQGAGENGAALAPTQVDELVRDVALEALQDARGKVRIQVEADDDLTPLEAVEPELRAVVQALVVNAVEASSDGAEVEVTVRAADREDAIEIHVADRGPGLPAKIRERLFTPHLTTKATGSGMGLFLAQRIAGTRYGGSLRLDDREGGGTVAVLEIGERRDPQEDLAGGEA